MEAPLVEEFEGLVRASPLGKYVSIAEEFPRLQKQTMDLLRTGVFRDVGRTRDFTQFFSSLSHFYDTEHKLAQGPVVHQRMIQHVTQHLTQQVTQFPNAPADQWIRDILLHTRGGDMAGAEVRSSLLKGISERLPGHIREMDTWLQHFKMGHAFTSDPRVLQKFTNLSTEVLERVNLLKQQYLDQTIDQPLLQERITQLQTDFSEKFPVASQEEENLRQLRDTLAQSRDTWYTTVVGPNQQRVYRVHLSRLGVTTSPVIRYPVAHWEGLYGEISPGTVSNIRELPYDMTNSNPAGDLLYTGTRLERWNAYQQSLLLQQVGGGAAGDY